MSIKAAPTTAKSPADTTRLGAARLAAFSLCLVLMGCDTGPDLPLKSANGLSHSLPDAISLTLREDLTEEQVIALAGQPTRVSVQTCGQQAREWRCKAHNYDGPRFSDGSLVVFFRQTGGGWRVNSWKVIR